MLFIKYDSGHWLFKFMNIEQSETIGQLKVVSTILLCVSNTGCYYYHVDQFDTLLFMSDLLHNPKKYECILLLLTLIKSNFTITYSQ